MKTGCSLFVGFVIVAIVWQDLSNSNKETIDLPYAQEYTVFNEYEPYDFSFLGRKRLGWTIKSPTAFDDESRAHTVMKAALDLHGSWGGDIVTVELREREVQKGLPQAMAFYSPDGGGLSGDETNRIWEVKLGLKQFDVD